MTGPPAALAGEAPPWGQGRGGLQAPFCSHVHTRGATTSRVTLRKGCETPGTGQQGAAEGARGVGVGGCPRRRRREAGTQEDHSGVQPRVAEDTEARENGPRKVPRTMRGRGEAPLWLWARLTTGGRPGAGQGRALLESPLRAQRQCTARKRLPRVTGRDQ